MGQRFRGGMDGLTVFGLFAVGGMLIFYALEQRSHWCVLAFAAACGLASIYGFLQGAWPFGVVEAIWAGVAIWRWRQRVNGSLAVGLSLNNGPLNNGPLNNGMRPCTIAHRRCCALTGLCYRT